ncbi:protein kinase domain containing protein [Entamoeba marina]
MILSPLDGLDSFIQRDISLKKGLYSFNFTPIHLEHAFSFFEQHSIYHVTEKGLKHASVNELAEWARAESLEVSDFIKENKINGKEILLHANEINTLLNGTIILQKYKKYKRSYGENMLKQRNNNMVDKFVFQLINSPVPLQNPYSPQQIYFDSIRLFFMTNHDIIDPITAFSIGKLKSSHSSCIEKDIIHLLNDIGVVRMNTFIRTLHFIQNITKIPNCFWCDCLDLFQAYMLNLLIPSKSFEEIRFLLDIPFEIPTYECFDSNELYIGEYVLDSFEDVLIPLKMIRVEESVSEITTENWIQGTLFITNYRLYFSTKNTNYLFTDIVYVSHCPIQMIRVAHFYTNKKIYDNHSITKDNKYIWRIATKDFRYITFAFQEPETIKYVKKAFHDAKQTISPISYNDLFGELVDTKHIPVPNNHHISNDIRQVFVSPNGISINGHTLGYVNTSQATVYRIKSTTPLTIESISTLFKSVEEFFYSNDQVKTTPLDDEKHFSSTHFKYYNHGIVLFNFSNEDNKGNTLLPQSEIDTLIRPFCDKIPNKKDIDALQTCLDNLHQLLYKLVTETNNNNIILLATSPNNETDLGILTSILCVAIDPFSRTIEGLLRIIHDEFCLQGVFETAVEKVFWPSYFILFLCLVHSFYVEYPTAFEYTPEALAFLFFHCQSGRFQFFTSQPTCSIKRVLQRFINPKYQMREEVLFKKEVNVYPLCEYFQPMLSLEKYVDNNVKLDCSYCGLKYFPSFKSHIKYLSVATYLDLSFNTIPTLTLFTQSQTLQHLNISNNPFRHIDKSLFTSCPNLTFLDISASHHVEIGKIPELTTLTKLLFLNISNLLLLHQYSDSMSFPISLKTLIAKDSFQELPPSLFTLKLHSLKLSGALHSKHDLFLMTELHTLSLANMHLSTVPSVVSNLVSLTHLDLSNNRLIALPHQLYSLTSLKQLFLKENNIQFISHQLSQLTSLTKLQLPEMCHCPVKHPTLISSPRFNLKQPKTVHILLFNKVAYNEDSCYQTLRSYLTQLKCVHSDFITLKEDHPLIIHRMETNIHINPLDFPQSDIYMSIVDDTEYMHQLKESHSFYLRILPVDQKVVIAVHANTNNTTKIDTSDISNVAHTVFGPRPFNIITLRDPKKTESLLKKHLCVASEPTPLPNENLLLYEVSINSFDPSLTYTTTLLPLLEKCNIPLLNLPQYLIRLHYYGAIFL